MWPGFLNFLPFLGGNSTFCGHAICSRIRLGKSFTARSQPEFPRGFKMVDFQSIFVMFSHWERRNGRLRAAAAARSRLPGCRTFSRPALRSEEPVDAFYILYRIPIAWHYKGNFREWVRVWVREWTYAYENYVFNLVKLIILNALKHLYFWYHPS